MIFGTGYATAKLLDSNGAVVATLTLPRCERRPDEDYEDVILSYGSDANGETVEDFLGVRFHAKYVWRSHADNQSEMATVQRLANWRGQGRTVQLNPHNDQPTQMILCEVKGNPIKPTDGRLLQEQITVELVGIYTLPSKPNPTYERVGRAFGRGAITA